MFNSVPSDNLYKFVCVIGLTILTASLTISPYLLKATVETVQIAEALKASHVPASSAYTIQGNRIRTGPSSDILEQSVDEYDLILQRAHAQVDDLQQFRRLGYVVGTLMFVIGFYFWLRKTQLPSDRTASLAGTTPKILDEKHDLVLALGPILREASHASIDNGGQQRFYANAASKLLTNAKLMQSIRDRYGSVMPLDALMLFEQILTKIRNMQFDRSHIEYSFASDDDIHGIDEHEHTAREIEEAMYEQREREDNARRSFLETAARDSGILTDVAVLYASIENDVRRFVS